MLRIDAEFLADQGVKRGVFALHEVDAATLACSRFMPFAW